MSELARATSGGRLAKAHEYVLQNWNALLAGTSLAGVAVFSLIPPLQNYVGLFVFLAANSVVWTVVELKVQLGKTAAAKEQIHPTMRAARSHIVAEIERRLSRSSESKPLRLTLIGGRMRSMGDIVREVSDDLVRGHVRGHLVVDAYCIDPDYLTNRVLPGDMDEREQRVRNAGIGHLVRSVKTELEALSRDFGPSSSIDVKVHHYQEDPFCYAYLIHDDMLFWGPFTWDRATSDLLGPENPCLVVNSTSPSFAALCEWIQTRTQLMSESSARGAPHAVSLPRAPANATRFPRSSKSGHKDHP